MGWCLSNTASLTWTLHFMVRVSNGGTESNKDVYSYYWLSAFFYLTLATNVLSTGSSSSFLSWVSPLINSVGLLAYRIFSIDREVSRAQASIMKRSIRPIMMIIVDAGIFYTVLLLIIIILFATKSNALPLMIGMVSSPTLPVSWNT